MIPHAPAIAAQECTRRLALVEEAQQSARLEPAQAHTLRRCWLAIAAACGAHRELPQLVCHTKLAFPPERAGEPAVLHYAPEDFIHRSAWQGELRRALATARGKARDDASAANCRRVAVLLIIAIAAGVVPMPTSAAPERIAA
ncbi:hypothetical protein [Alteriqipengyuania sp.]|uniref:hypothetical protein n=1 Tax=Alteriqipengyuania sp. TaxID=2800692 RepID=UPI003514F145